MKSIKKINGLNGLIATRGELLDLQELANSENQHHLSEALSIALANDGDTFTINLPEPVATIIENENGLSIAEQTLILPSLEYISEPDNEGLNGVSPNDIYNYITDLIINTIKKVGHLPWQKNWTGAGAGGGAKNFVSKKEYTGANFILNFDVEIDENSKGYLVPKKFIQPYYLTFNQILDLKASLKKGSKAHRVIYYTMIFDFDNGALKFKTSDKSKFDEFVKSKQVTKEDLKIFLSKIPVLKYYNVFLADDCTGLTFTDEKPTEKTVNPIVEAQRLIDGYQDAPKYTFIGDKAYYQPANDVVNMPKIDAFQNEASYYCTYFHEIVHSTGAKKRLNRDFSGAFRSKNYAYEELIAELGAVFMCSEAGILFHTVENSAKYLYSWNKRLISALEDDNRFFLKASAQSQKAVNYILQNEKDSQSEESKVNELTKKTDLFKTNPKPFSNKPKSISVATAIKDVLSLPKYKGLSLLSSTILFNKYKNYPDPTIEITSQFEIGILSKESKLYSFYTHNNELEISSFGIEFLKAVIGRLDSLKNQKNNFSLFDGLNGQQNVSTDLFKKMTVAELRKFTLDYYNENLKGKKVEIKKHLKQVVFTVSAGKKIARGGTMYSEKSAVVDCLEELIKNSTYNNWGKRKPKDTNEVIGYLNFKSKIIIDNVKRHVRISLVVFKNRKTELKNFEVGEIKKSDKLNAELQSSNLQDDVSKSLSKDKYNKNNTKNTNTALNCPHPEKKPARVQKKNTEVKPKVTVLDKEKKTDLIQPKKTVQNLENVNKNSIAYQRQLNKTQVREYFKIDNPEIARFYGKIEKKTKESVAITIAGGEGSMKTRHCFQLINAFAQNYKVGHASIEEHPQSSLYEKKVDQYLNAKAQNSVENPEINSIEDITSLINNNDVIVIDSFTKLQEMQNGIELDKDFRKKYNGKLFIIIYQLTTNKTMRGGSKSQFDCDIITVVEKFPDYTKNYIQATKNRYNDIPATELKFNIFSGKMLGQKQKNNVQLKFN